MIEKICEEGNSRPREADTGVELRDERRNRRPKAQVKERLRSCETRHFPIQERVVGANWETCDL